MSKAGKKVSHAANEAIAKSHYIKGGERKLNLLAQMIRGKSVQRALIDLEFARRRMAGEVKKVLQSAIANAENNHNLDVDRLFVKTAIVGKTLVMRRVHTRGRGRTAPVEKPFSNITIIVSERPAGEQQKKKGAVKGAAKGKGKKAEASKQETAKAE